MKKSEINKEAKDLIKDVFSAVLTSKDKDSWKKAIDFIMDETNKYEKIWGEKKFIRREVRSIITNRYGKLFINKNKWQK